MMTIPKLTLDTNLLHTYWKRRDKVEVVERLLSLARQAKVDLAVTARVREDIPRLPSNVERTPRIGVIGIISMLTTYFKEKYFSVGIEGLFACQGN